MEVRRQIQGLYRLAIRGSKGMMRWLVGDVQVYAGISAAPMMEDHTEHDTA